MDTDQKEKMVLLKLEDLKEMVEFAISEGRIEERKQLRKKASFSTKQVCQIFNFSARHLSTHYEAFGLVKSPYSKHQWTRISVKRHWNEINPGEEFPY